MRRRQHSESRMPPKSRVRARGSFSPGAGRGSLSAGPPRLPVAEPRGERRGFFLGRPTTGGARARQAAEYAAGAAAFSSLFRCSLPRAERRGRCQPVKSRPRLPGGDLTGLSPRDVIALAASAFPPRFGSRQRVMRLRLCSGPACRRCGVGGGTRGAPVWW